MGPPNVLASGPPRPAEPSGTLGAYTILTRLASGGMATVFAGTKLGMAGFERLVAIKCCHPHLSRDEEFITMFLDEARLAARIHHPNVVATLDVGSTEFLYLVMEYVEGDSLSGLLRRARERRTTVPLEVTVRVLIDTLAGLHAAHELRGPDGQALNLVHRDVSPQNILVGADGISRITDFGIAFAAARSTNTQEGKLKGKFSYMAPEQVRGDVATRRIDVFAAGIVLWEALTGRALFRRKDDVATINAVLRETVIPPSDIVHTLPKGLDAVVLKALERNPDSRFATAEEFGSALEELNVDRVSPKSVATYVDATLGAELAQRRETLRIASEEVQHGSGFAPSNSDVHPKLVIGPGGDVVDPVEAEVTAILTAPSAAPTEDMATQVAAEPLKYWSEAPLPPGEIEHRRMRGLLAAAMLLLVGGAIGLLIARSNAGARAPAPPTSSHVPTSRPGGL
jgi:eukaryotic-like serine/threonine-protein kinase